MLRLVVGRIGSSVRNATITRATAVGVQSSRNVHGFSESDEELDARYINFFNRPDIDGWEARKAINELAGMDCVPEPSIICAVLRSCRRLNDFAMAVRFLECVKDKCGSHVKVIYPYILQEIRPTLEELGINTPEELGYDKPELALEDPEDM